MASADLSEQRAKLGLKKKSRIKRRRQIGGTAAITAPRSAGRIQGLRAFQQVVASGVILREQNRARRQFCGESAV